MYNVIVIRRETIEEILAEMCETLHSLLILKKDDDLIRKAVIELYRWLSEIPHSDYIHI